MIEKPGIKRRHAHQRGRARHRGQDRIGVEPGLKQHCRAGKQRDIDGDEQAVGMEDRQRVNEDVVRGEAPEIDENLGVGDKVVVGQHRALRAARGA